MKRSLKTSLVELPFPILGMLAIAHAQYDTLSECRQWGGYGILGHGLTIGLTLWTVTQDRVALEDGTRVDCVRLTKRENHLHAIKKDPVDYYFPFEALRAGVAAELTLAEEA